MFRLLDNAVYEWYSLVLHISSEKIDPGTVLMIIRVIICHFRRILIDLLLL
jgi:hypothetical protein